MRVDIYLCYLGLRLLSLLPLRVLHALGACLGRMICWCRARVARYGEVNVKIARPLLAPAAQRILVRKALEESGKGIMELAKIWGGGAQRALRLVREVRGEALLDAVLARGKGVIIAFPHHGCWELLNYWFCRKTPVAILYRSPRLAALEPLLRKVRGVLAPEQVRAEKAGVRSVYRRLTAGGAIGIAPDQKPRMGEGQFAPFYGREALTMVLLSRLAARTGATVLFSFAERLPRGKGYRIHILPAPEGIDSDDLRNACSALNQGVERCIELAFTQYQWTYKRYSQNPVPGEASPYKQ